MFAAHASLIASVKADHRCWSAMVRLARFDRATRGLAGLLSTSPKASTCSFACHVVVRGSSHRRGGDLVIEALAGETSLDGFEAR
jgi:hypothetical protein